jgi:hypothetical protein
MKHKKQVDYLQNIASLRAIVIAHVLASGVSAAEMRKQFADFVAYFQKNPMSNVQFYGDLDELTLQAIEKFIAARDGTPPASGGG